VVLSKHVENSRRFHHHSHCRHGIGDSNSPIRTTGTDPVAFDMLSNNLDRYSRDPQLHISLPSPLLHISLPSLDHCPLAAESLPTQEHSYATHSEPAPAVSVEPPSDSLASASEVLLHTRRNRSGHSSALGAQLPRHLLRCAAARSRTGASARRRSSPRRRRPRTCGSGSRSARRAGTGTQQWAAAAPRCKLPLVGAHAWATASG